MQVSFDAGRGRLSVSAAAVFAAGVKDESQFFFERAF
jgi:hypothetical protein